MIDAGQGIMSAARDLFAGGDGAVFQASKGHEGLDG
jgi:hypothetical protein